LDRLGGKLFEELGQTAVLVGVGGRLLGGLRQIGAALASEELLQVALFQYLNGGLPVFLAADGQLVEVLTGLSRGQRKRTAEGLLADADRPAEAPALPLCPLSATPS